MSSGYLGCCITSVSELLQFWKVFFVVGSESSGNAKDFAYLCHWLEECKSQTFAYFF